MTYYSIYVTYVYTHSVHNVASSVTVHSVYIAIIILNQSLIGRNVSYLLNNNVGTCGVYIIIAFI